MLNSKINYASESVDITRQCSRYLIENNFYENSEQTNLDLLKKALVNYSILKLASWNIDLQKIDIPNWDNLESILAIINQRIKTDKEKTSYFSQYTHCIIYIYSNIKKNTPISWIEMEDAISPYNFVLKDNELVEMFTDKNTISYKVPIALLEELNLINTRKEKNPILHK